MTNIYHKIKSSKMNIVKEYMDFRLSNITSEQLIEKTIGQLRILIKLDPAECTYPLINAHLFIVTNKVDKAKDILSIYEKSEKELIESEPFVYAYYIYLKCLFFEDKQLQQRGSIIVSNIADKLAFDWRPQWLRLYLDEEISKNKQLKLHLLQETFHNKCSSPIMYLELCTLLNENPTMLRTLEGIELQALWWGAKNNYINNELAIKVILVSHRTIKYNKLLYKLLAKLHNTYQEKEFVKAICNLLIQGERKDKVANEWYKKGIEEQIRVTGLNEYYIESIDREDFSILPQTLIRYFVYNTNILDVSKEYIYANIISYQATQTIELYSKQILIFAEEQLSKKKINRFLATIYQYIIESQKTTRSFILKLLEVVFTKKMLCNNEKMIAVVVSYTDFEEEVTLPLIDGIAYIDIYSPNHFISFIDDNDNRYSNGIAYSITNVLNDISYVEEAYEKGLFNNRSLVHLASQALDINIVNDKTIEIISQVLTLKGLNNTYTSNLACRVLKEYTNRDNFDIPLNVIKEIKLNCLPYNDVVMVIECYINKNLVEEAIHALKVYGHNDIPITSLCSLCEQMLTRGMYDNTMISICEGLILEGNENKKVVLYMIEFYDSSLSKMRIIWEKALEIGINKTALEERVIEQLIFIEVAGEEYMPIVESYSKENPNSPLLDQFFRFSSYLFLLGRIAIPNQSIEMIQTRLEMSGENNLYEYTLIKFYSMKKDLTTKEKEWVQQIGLKLYKQKRLVSWFKDFGDEIHLPNGVNERSYIEYFSSSIAKVVLHYRYNFEEDYISQEMKQVADGLFVGNVLLFFNESFQYYIEETMNDSTNIVSSERFVIEEHKSKYVYDINSSNYEQINSMIIARKNNEIDKLDRILDQYIETDNKISKYFKPL